MEIRNRRLGDDEFLQERRAVLAEWPTGKDIADLDELVEYHKGLPPTRLWTKKMAEAKQKGETLLSCGMGKATLEEHAELLKYVRDVGGADLLVTSADSFTRTHNYKAAEHGIEESIRLGKSVLNGFPIVNHGAIATRKVLEQADRPVQLRSASPDPRMMHEMTFASGHTANGADGIFAFWHFNSKLSVEVVLHNFQYCWRLRGYYEERGAPLSSLVYGMETYVTPPSLVTAAQMTQILMMAEQGVKHVLLGFHGQWHLAQDVAGANTLRKLAHEYLNRFGYHDVVTDTEFIFGVTKHPTDTNEACAVIGMCWLWGRLCGAQVSNFRSIAEAKTIPTKEEIAASFKCGKMVAELLEGQKLEPDGKEVAIEAVMHEREARAIIDKVIELGDGDIAVGTVKAVESGVLDNPHGTHPSVACKVMGVRDSEGAVRYLDHGNLPFTKDIIEFHKEKIAQRAKKLGRQVNYETLIQDILSTRMGRGSLY